MDKTSGTHHRRAARAVNECELNCERPNATLAGRHTYYQHP